jgi:hypothetical protein
LIACWAAGGIGGDAWEAFCWARACNGKQKRRTVEIAKKRQRFIMETSKLDARYWMLDTGCWMLDAGSWMLVKSGHPKSGAIFEYKLGKCKQENEGGKDRDRRSEVRDQQKKELSLTESQRPQRVCFDRIYKIMGILVL